MSIETQTEMGFQLCTAYSGATFFSLLLDRHPAISCDGETFPFNRDETVSCSCGRPQIDCHYYRHVAAHMLDPTGKCWNWDLFTHGPQYSRMKSLQYLMGVGWSCDLLNRYRRCLIRLVPSLRSKEERYLDAHQRYIANSLKFKRARIYVDGTKQWPRAEFFARSSRLRLKAIHLIRDGRGFCNSYIKNLGFGKPGLVRAVRSWNKHIRELDSFRKRFPDTPVLLVRYEDLCRDLRSTMERVCDFLRVPRASDLANRSSRDSHVLGNRMRLQSTQVVKEDLSWRNELNHEDVKRIESGMEPYLQRFGYT